MFHFPSAKRDTTNEVGIKQGLFTRRNVLLLFCNRLLEADLGNNDPFGIGVLVYE